MELTKTYGFALVAAVLAGLYEVRDEVNSENYYGDLGLCSKLEDTDGGIAAFGVPGYLPGQFNSLKQDLFRTWSGFSGDLTYPVPAPYDWYTSGTDRSERASAEERGHEYCFDDVDHDDYNDGDFWSGEYGDSRRGLLDHMIAVLEAEPKALPAPEPEPASIAGLVGTQVTAKLYKPAHGGYPGEVLSVVGTGIGDTTIHMRD